MVVLYVTLSFGVTWAFYMLSFWELGQLVISFGIYVAPILVLWSGKKGSFGYYTPLIDDMMG